MAIQSASGYVPKPSLWRSIPVNQSMTAKRWRTTALGAAGAYVIYLVASAADGIWNVPGQIHSVVLTALGVGVLLAAGNVRQERRDLVTHADVERAERKAANQLGQVHRDLTKRLEHVRGCLAALEGPTQPIPAVVGVSAIYRSAGTAAESEWQVNDDEIRGFLARELTDPEDEPPPGPQ